MNPVMPYPLFGVLVRIIGGLACPRKMRDDLRRDLLCSCALHVGDTDSDCRNSRLAEPMCRVLLLI
eukprot:SAG31_NODE_1984_length_6740_cov_4.949255_11_plen_66_part_00